ncbi:MAG: 23S rRNA (uracil(1939)-C(5))-methyltransferase RlmD [Butyrivibrio sp.]|uniref:23S rRNA (uracil(1939)-C(5))-methyltransferase RlmD n=1 Tax=Butyrivibrio sp. TaxID=28121 RepID=UPI001B06AFDE|nr:23S rRNA (uracil(1939)-C(5))-methyltransferase RlmD [Butyrivibrio sp.]MBO6240710.1 23S rRNA (uracil(1939)-C(5))-methyltransferase RlmD [Butyrivibrio sp.]
MSKKIKTDCKYQKDDLLTVEITDIGNDGEGIGKVDGYTLFIKDAVIGDKVSAKIMKAKKNYAYAHLEKVLEPSVHRQEARCPIARQCGGCQLQNMTYERQLEFKQNKVRNNIVRLGGFDESFIDSIMEPIIGMEEPWRYRNKAQYPIGTDKNGKPVAGYYAGRTHSIIPVDDCFIGVEENKEILDIVLAHMKKHGIAAYDEATGKGLIRHVLIRKGFTSGQIMVCLVINYRGKNSKENTASAKRQNELSNVKGSENNLRFSDGSGVEFIAAQNELVKALQSISGMTSISVNINTEKTNVIMGREVHTIWGKDTISDTLCGLEFEISPLSFYQVNPKQAQRLYEQAITYADLTGNETVWDLYCGIGTISLAMAKSAGKVYGVEIIPDAIEDAKRNASRNGLGNAEFFCGKAEEVLPEFYDRESAKAAGKTSDASALHPDVIVVDPPRKGCDEKCLETMLKMSPDRIVYVSCDSATLARDLRILADGGYSLEKIRACDMFSWSGHVETVVLLSQQKPDDHIEIEINLDEIDATSAESKATYKEIEEWVQEHYGFHVTNLNIAQVKQKHGIIERENYNKRKSENSRQPGCPEEKVKAIEDALRHFQMISDEL